MSQVSRPMQILLVVTVAFAAVWFVALRPKADDSSAAPEPAASAAAEPKSSLPGSLGDGVDKAKDASKQSDAANAQREAAEQRATGEASGSATATSGATQGSPASSSSGSAPPDTADAPAKARTVARTRPAAAATATPGRVAAAVADGKVAVVLFWDRRGAVDKQVRSELGPAGARGGRVFVVAAPISQVSRFDVVTRGIQVLQAPTVVVISPKRQARVLSGYIDGAEIRQAVADALARR